jgi:NAD-reducing hydrogenase small subunit
MRNRFPSEAILHRAYFENARLNRQVPHSVIPPLLPTSRPVHEFVKVDVFVAGCPPSADTIYFVLTELLAGKTPDLKGKTRFGV